MTAAPFWTDWTHLCTSFAAQAVNIQIQALKEAGMPEDLWQQTLTGLYDLDCPTVATSTTSSLAVGIQDMQGIFIIYGITVVIAFIVRIIECCVGVVKRRRRKDPSVEDSTQESGGENNQYTGEEFTQDYIPGPSHSPSSY